MNVSRTPRSRLERQLEEDTLALERTLREIALVRQRYRDTSAALDLDPLNGAILGGAIREVAEEPECAYIGRRVRRVPG